MMMASLCSSQSLTNKLLAGFCFGLMSAAPAPQTVYKAAKNDQFLLHFTICIKKVLKLANKTDMWGHF